MNITPVWMLGEYHQLYNQMEDGIISKKDFVYQIQSIEEVPKFVKDNWLDQLED